MNLIPLPGDIELVILNQISRFHMIPLRAVSKHWRNYIDKLITHEWKREKMTILYEIHSAEQNELENNHIVFPPPPDASTLYRVIVFYKHFMWGGMLYITCAIAQAFLMLYVYINFLHGLRDPFTIFDLYVFINVYLALCISRDSFLEIPGYHITIEESVATYNTRKAFFRFCFYSSLIYITYFLGSTFYTFFVEMDIIKRYREKRRQVLDVYS